MMTVITSLALLSAFAAVILLVWSTEINVPSAGWVWGALGVILLSIISVGVLVYRTLTAPEQDKRGANDTGNQGKGLGTGDYWQKTKDWIKKNRNNPLLYGPYFLIVWWTGVGTSWIFRSEVPTIWKFLWEDNWRATWVSPLIVLTMVYFILIDSRLIKTMALVVVGIVAWVWITKLTTPLTEKEFSLFAGDQVLPAIRTEKPAPRLIDRFTITSDAWKTFDLPTGRSRVKVLGPTEAQAFYRNEYRETLTFEGGNYIAGNGPTDQLRLRALKPGEVVSVEIYQIQ